MEIVNLILLLLLAVVGAIAFNGIRREYLEFRYYVNKVSEEQICKVKKMEEIVERVRQSRAEFESSRISLKNTTDYIIREHAKIPERLKKGEEFEVAVNLRFDGLEKTLELRLENLEKTLKLVNKSNKILEILKENESDR